MESIRPLIFMTLIFFAPRLVTAQSFEFPVEHQHTLRNCSGTLIIAPNGVEYRTTHKRDARSWQYADLQQIKIESATAIELVSYEDQKLLLGRDRLFKFKVLKGELSAEVSAFLMSKTARPVVTSVMPVLEGTLVFVIPVKHLHRFGGCIGTLKIYHDRISYESQSSPSDSRFWRYTDIQNFSQSARYRFEIITFEDKFVGPKAYNFQLREELPARAYDYLWVRIYPVKFRRAEQ